MLIKIYSKNMFTEGEPFTGKFGQLQMKSKTAYKKPDIYAMLTGVYPQNKLNEDKDIISYLDPESRSWYHKAMASYRQNYGIASFAYFQRIIEKELFHVLKDISQLTDANPKIEEMIVAFLKDKKADTLYENVYEFLPESFQSLGKNPFKLLYVHTSVQDLQSLSDQEYLVKIDILNSLLKFVITKLKEEMNVLMELKKAIKSLE